MADFITDYFITPIWDRTGYNLINTVIYGVIALLAAFFIYKTLRREKIIIDARFVISVVPYMLLGSTARVITDAIDTGAMAMHRGNPIADWLLSSHIYDYGYFTVTPGIYIVVGLLTIAAVFGFNRLKRPELILPVGAALWLSQLVMLSPLFAHFEFALLAIGLAAAAAYAGHLVLRKFGYSDRVTQLMVFAHALDGAATFVIIDVFGPAVGKEYFEQHVVSRALGLIGDTMFTFFLVKVAFATIAAWLVRKESTDAQEANFIALLIIIFGLAPGMRDLLRMLAGA